MATRKLSTTKPGTYHTAAGSYACTIEFDAETRDFAYSLNGELLGFARTYDEAQNTLDEAVARCVTAELTRRQAGATESACPTCGSDGSPCADCNPIDLATLVPDPATWVAVSEVPCEPDAEAELDQRERELAARCACFATGTEQPECLARGTSCDREARRLAWLARQERMRETARRLGLLGTLDPSPAPVIVPDPHPSPEMPLATFAAAWNTRSQALAGVANALRGEGA